MHYRQLMTLDIGNDALLCKYFLPAYKDRPSHGFIAYLQLCWACPTSSGLDPLERTHPQGIVVGDVPSKDHGHTTETCRFPVSGRKAHKSRAFEAIPPIRYWGRDAQHNNPGTLGPSCPQGRYKLYYGGPSDEE
ncbi:hypothetical protein CK203_006877 [Vitis vinifera]|uniref:Uncharacterized protein n=1 Tax=Vitis vinifera TaxID=29760 RepID=A0A438KCA7_VITVI|nr:hypothetical protein CK203_006877 [Vitis vinifera]